MGSSIIVTSVPSRMWSQASVYRGDDHEGRELPRSDVEVPSGSVTPRGCPLPSHHAATCVRRCKPIFDRREVM